MSENQEVKKDEKELDKNQAWMEERKSKRAKRAKKPKVIKHQKSIEGKVEREAINEVEDLLVRTAFSALL